MSVVGFVDNPDSNNSRVQTLTIEEYQARRLAHALNQQMMVGEAAGSPAGNVVLAATSTAGHDFAHVVGS